MFKHAKLVQVVGKFWLRFEEVTLRLHYLINGVLIVIDWIFPKIACLLGQTQCQVVFLVKSISIVTYWLYATRLKLSLFHYDGEPVIGSISPELTRDKLVNRITLLEQLWIVSFLLLLFTLQIPSVLKIGDCTKLLIDTRDVSLICCSHRES